MSTFAPPIALPVSVPVPASGAMNLTARWEELKRRYPSDAPTLPWRALPDAQLRADLRVAAARRDRPPHMKARHGARTIETWIAAELHDRAQLRALAPRPGDQRRAGRRPRDADERTRTSTELPPHGPEPCASTNSATSAGRADRDDIALGRGRARARALVPSGAARRYRLGD